MVSYTFMRIAKSVIFLCSLAIMYVAQSLRYFYLRAFGAQKSVQGVRVILVRDARVVLVRHWYAPGVWTLPGGGVMNNERITEAGKREVYEEVGFEVDSFGGEVGTYVGSMGKKDSVIVLFSEKFDGSMKLLPGIEIMERGLFDLKSLPENISPANRRRIEAYLSGVRSERGVW